MFIWKLWLWVWAKYWGFWAQECMCLCRAKLNALCALPAGQGCIGRDVGPIRFHASPTSGRGLQQDSFYGGSWQLHISEGVVAWKK